MNAAARLIALLLTASPAWAQSELEHWVEYELVPYVLETLTSHPRFSGERVRFVVFDGDATAASASELELGIRDRLVAAAIEAGGIRIASGTAAGKPSGERFDCTDSDAHYAIGIALLPQSRAQWKLSLRARDLAERRLVTGFGRTWRGRLDPGERLAASRDRADAMQTGERGAPFEAHQADLLAAYLARRLACAVARQTRGLYVVSREPEPRGDDVFPGTLELIGNNVAAHPAFDLAETAAGANASLSARAHRIDGPLHQYWLTLTPRDRAAELDAISASAYVRLPGGRTEVERPAAVDDARRSTGVVAVPRAGEPLLGTLRLEPGPHRCSARAGIVRGARHDPARAACSLIEASVKTDTVVFVLAHRPSLGLVRIDDGACRRRTQPMLLRKRETLSFPIPWHFDENARVREVSNWLSEPAGEVYYAIAVADSSLARRIASHLDRLPQRCGADRHRGIRHGALENWVAGLAALVSQAGGRADWRAIELKRVY